MTTPHSLTGVGGLFNSRIMRTLIHHIGLLAGIQEQNKTVLRGKEMSVLHRIPQAWLLIEDGIIKDLRNARRNFHAERQENVFEGRQPAVGQFYLYNVGNEGFLVGGNDQTTRASLTSQGGIPVTLLPTATVGEYYISTAPTYPDRFLGSDGYVDKLSSSSKYTSWKFVAVDGLDNTYTIQATNDTKNYIFGHNTDVTKTTVDATAPNNSKAYWKLVTKEDLITNLANATESNPIDVTWAVMNPYFGAYCDIPLWTGDYTTYNGVDNNN